MQNKPMNLKFNSKQSEHFAGSARAYALGQMAAFGYTGFQSAHWPTVVLSVGVLIIFEIGAYLLLQDVEDKA